MKQKELAALLGISPASVSKLKRQGMPVDSPERAQRWRKRNLEPGRIKGTRFDPNQSTQPTMPTVSKPDAEVADTAAELLTEVEAAGVSIDQALATCDEEWASATVTFTRDLLRKISDDAQPRMSLRVWLALVEWFIDPDSAIVKAPDQAAMLTPVEFAVRWHGWENTPNLNSQTLDLARDWEDFAINGIPYYPEDD